MTKVTQQPYHQSVIVAPSANQDLSPPRPERFSFEAEEAAVSPFNSQDRYAVGVALKSVDAKARR